jgi:Holliday junction resolvase RusA-like endonuclease
MADEPLVSIVLGGAPMGKKRHRARVVIPKKGRPWVQTYPDPDGVAYEADLAAAGREAMAAAGLVPDPFDGPLTVFVEAFVPIPESWSLKKKAAAAAGDISPTSKPDGDNYAKIAGDALNKICWIDDSQIIMWQVLKQYSDFPRLRISVWPWNDIPAAEPELL